MAGRSSSSKTPRGRARRADEVARHRERYGRRRLLRDLRRTGPGDPLRAGDRRARSATSGSRYAPGSTRASARSSTRSWVDSRSRSAPASGRLRRTVGGPRLADREGPRRRVRALLRGRRRARAQRGPRPVAPLPGGERVSVTTPDTRYATTPDGAYIAYQVVGDGPVDLVWQFDFFGNVDVVWEQPRYSSWWSELASFSRLILHDRRGTGLSSRNVPVPNLETRVQDLAVRPRYRRVRTRGARRSSGGWGAQRTVRQHGSRARAARWSGGSRTRARPRRATTRGARRPSTSIAPTERRGRPGARRSMRRCSSRRRPSPGPSMRSIPTMTDVMARLSRHTGTPDVGLGPSRVWRDTDVRAVLPSVKTPTLLMSRRAHPEEALYIASLMPNATVELFAGTSIDQWEDQDALVEAIRRWVGVAPLRARIRHHPVDGAVHRHRRLDRAPGGAR